MNRERAMKYPVLHVPASRGFTLIELMIALVIGLIISIGVVQIFSSNRASYQLDESLARAQENGRFALEFLTQEIRQAGNLGCKRDAMRPGEQAPGGINPRLPYNYLANPVSATYPLFGITGLEYPSTGFGQTYNATAGASNTTTGWLPPSGGAPSFTALVPSSGAGAGALPGSDVIAVQRLESSALTVVAPYVTPDNVYVSPTDISKINVNDILMLAGCGETAAIFQVTGTDPSGSISHVTGVGSPGNKCGTWEANLTGSSNAASAECTNKFERYLGPNRLVIGRLIQTVFYVANDPNNQGRPSLYRNVLDASGTPISPAQPLVEGVETLQVFYGVDDSSDGIADRYSAANSLSVTTLPLVVSANINLLVHGINATGTANDSSIDQDTYTLGETTFDPPDDRLKRRSFSTTIQLRNRGL